MRGDEARGPNQRRKEGGKAGVGDGDGGVRERGGIERARERG